MADNKDNSDNDEIDLFRAEMRDTKPLHHNDKLLHLKPKPKATVQVEALSAPHSQHDPFSDMYAHETVENEQYLEYQGPGIQHRTFAKLRSGKIHIEADLDLHGVTLAVARPTLNQFLEQCQQERIKYVRLIHGKGWNSKDNKPVIKSSLNHWLRENNRVLAFCSATIDDGGTGALYLIVKAL